MLDPLPEARRRPRLIVCLGNDLRGDDGAGPAVAAGLRARGVDVRLEQPPNLVDLFAEADGVVVVDAVRSGAAPGTVHRVDARARALPPELTSASTHLFGLADAVELARVTGRLPESLQVLGIEGRSFEQGAALSPPVEAAVASVVHELAVGSQHG